MVRCYRSHVAGTAFEAAGGVVLDIGGSDVNGSYRRVFAPSFRYLAADLEAGPGVDLVLADAYALPLEDASADIVISGQAFEHIGQFWRTFAEMARVLKPDGFMFLIAPSAGPEHRYPVDCYRFYPDAYAALADSAACDLVETWLDERGPWRDLVGVFRHRGAKAWAKLSSAPARGGEWGGAPGSAEEEELAGAAPYLEVLARLHGELAPRSYLEIGVRRGHSLALARCAALGVDPVPEVEVALAPTTEIVACESDVFFEATRPGLAPELAFIDGLHLFEQALRDFMQVERIARPGSVLLIDDIFPNHPKQALRERVTRAWTGDVWKLAEVLRTHRPDLFVLPLDTHPSGMLLVAGLDPANRVLWNQYNPIVRKYAEELAVPDAVLARAGAIAPVSADFAAIVTSLKSAFAAQLGPRKTVAALRAARAGPKLSVVIVGYNMARELPRTIRSFSPAMQQGISVADYELILIDNGSTAPFDEAELLALAPNLSIHCMQDPTVSPVRAINLGLELARADLVGVCIDGARMASPGLLASALAAARLHDKPVIGALSFHLGPELQAKSAAKGYNQGVEDEMLAKLGWEEDGYRLFEASVLSGSSAKGWFATPAESSALFLRAGHWRELGGFDPAFVSPGGGLANLDAWRRACEDPSAELIMLLGEGTFHQVHGGAATGGPASRWGEFHAEYKALRGGPFRTPERRPLLFGAVGHAAGAVLRASVERLP